MKAFFRKVWTYDLVHAAVYAFALDIVIECLNRRGLEGFIFPFTQPIIFIYNVLIIMATLTIALMFSRRVFVYALIAATWFGLAVTNFVIQCTRKTPFTAMDFYLIKDGLKIADRYITVFHVILIVVGFVLVSTGLVVLWRKAPKIEVTISRGKFLAWGLVQVVLTTLAAYGMATTLLLTGVVEGHYGNLIQAYKKYGFAHCFVSSVVDRGISKPKGYSEEYMKNMKEELDGVHIDATEETPNFIFVQLESFFDPTDVKGLEFSENPLPNFQRLYKEYTSGYLSVPAFGAGTCNSEFEMQTGVNLDDFGPGEYPYRTVLQSNVCESMAYNLKKLGYSTHAIHNNTATFYDRDSVFKNLGYDTFTSIEFMDDVEYTPLGWAKDNVLIDEIGKTLDSTESTDYIFTISVQGHGDYPTGAVEGYTPKIKIKNFPVASQQSQFEYYVNQINEMDTFIGDLVKELSKREEKTVLVLYGDHLPTFDLTDEMLKSEDKFNTQYIVWSNFGMKKESKDLQAYQLSAYVAERVGISEGYIMKYHQSKEYKLSDEYLADLKMLEYDILYGKKEIYEGKTPFEPVDTKMGISDVSISDVYNYKKYILIEGKHFTEFSKVKIDGKDVTSELVSNRLIRVPDMQVKTGTIIEISQVCKDKTVLTTTEFVVKK